MEQNSEDALGTKRSAEIHSGVKPELAQREPPASELFCGISIRKQ